MDKLYSAQEVAARTGLSHERLRQFARKRNIRKVAGMFLWTEADIEALESRIGQRGKRMEDPED